MSRKFSDAFGVPLPIVQGGMGGVAGPDLVAAVSNAGGLGILPIWHLPVEQAKADIERTRSLTEQPFAVNIRADLHQTELIEVASEAGISLFNLFWGDPTPSMPTIAAKGGQLIATVGDLKAAKTATDCGAIALIVQGIEAGGHVLGEIPRDDLLQEIADANLSPVLIAAGGLASPDDIIHVRSLGADAALVGTRFVVARESLAHEEYKRAIIAAGHASTVRTTCFDGMWPDAPHRVLRNSTYEMWDAAGQPAEGQRPGEGDAILAFPNGTKLPRYFVMTPGQGMTGEIEASAMYAGMGVGEIEAEQTAAEIVADLVSKL